jgi:threonine/homoserine/homoserine lactone efflux protein
VADPTLFVLAVLTIVGMPGPSNALLATGGATDGLRRSLPLAPAEAAGYLVSMLTLGLALGPMVATSPAVAGVLRAAVIAYLALLTARLWRRGGAIPTGGPVGPVVTPAQLFLTTLLNPKGMVLALGIMPFDAPRLWPYLLGFLLLLAPTALGWIAIGALVGQAATDRERGRVVPRIGAAVTGAFAVLLLILPLLR